MTTMERKSLGLLKLPALPTIGAERWVPWVREADVLLADGGDATYLCRSTVEVVSEGRWKQFPDSRGQHRSAGSGAPAHAAERDVSVCDCLG
jgi:dipeptidase E